MIGRYWPDRRDDQHVDIAARRSLAGFCVLSGTAGVVVVLVSLQFFTDAPEIVLMGALASLICLGAPLWVNATSDFRHRARLVGVVLLVLLACIAAAGKTLVSPINILMLPGIMTYTLAVGWRTGLAYLLATLSVYVWCVVQTPTLTVFSATSNDLTLLAAMGAAAIFVFIGSLIFRREMVSAANRLDDAKQVAEVAMVHFRERAATDALTGAANRAAFDQILAAENARFHDSGRPFAVVVFDLDNFKRVNDTFGHLAGDRVLIETARVVKLTLRPCDTLGRIGGEEFAVILPGLSGPGADGMAERMREAISSVSVEVEGRGTISPTASFGVADSCQNSVASDLLERADEYLYRAKRGGRDRVESAHGASVTVPHRGRAS